MSLQGSLDTFALPDVLVLLASTKKTGELHVSGNRGPGGPRVADLQGLLWIEEGRLVGEEVAKAVDAATALFELLRLSEGSFSFVSGSAPDPHQPVDIEPVLAEAQAYLTEWREIEKVVPSLAAWLRLAPEAPAAHVTMRAEQWRLVVAIGGGCDVTSLVDALGNGELGACRAVKELAEAGLVEVTPESDAFAGLASPPPFAGKEAATPPFAGEEAAPPAAAGLLHPVEEARTSAPGPEEPAAAVEATDDFGDLVSLPGRSRKGRAMAARETADEPALDEDEPESLEAYATPRRATKGVLGATAHSDDTGPAGSLPEAQALARQLASLTENGAADPARVAGAADGLVEGEEIDGDEPLNRGLLLKFLSSVRN